MAEAARAQQDDTATDLLVMATVNPLDVFTDEHQFSEFYAKLKAETDKHVPNVSTPSGRAAVKSLAFKVTKAKTTLDKAGLGLTAEWRRQTDLVNAARKKMVTELDQLAAEVRRPLTEWEEAEKARIERCRAVIDQIKAAAIISLDDTAASVRERGTEVWQTEIGSEFGELASEALAAKEASVATLQRALVRLTQEEADRAELERLRAEAAEREAREAAEREERERSERERIAAEEAERRAREAAKAEERRLREAEERAAAAAREEEARKAREAEEERERQRQAEAAEQRRQHEEALAAERRQREEAERAAREERDRREREEAARRAEAERIAAEQARQAEEDRRREANRAHRTRVQKAAKEAIMTCGADEDTARKIVLAIIAGEIPAVTLRF